MEYNADPLLQSLNLDHAPQEDDPDQPKKAIRLARFRRAEGDSVQKLAFNRWYVEPDASLVDLADDLTQFATIEALAVIADEKPVGIIDRRSLFDLLGRPFGRDVLARESVEKVAQKTRQFDGGSNLMSVIEELRKEPGRQTGYFVVVDYQGEFAGVVALEDLLTYLAALARQSMVFARGVQARFSKEVQALKGPNAEIVGSTILARGLGSNSHVIKSTAHQHWFIATLDVVSNVPESSMMQTALWGALATFDYRAGLPSLASHLNALLVQLFAKQVLTHATLVDFDPAGGTFDVLGAGQALVYLYRGERLLKMKTAERSQPLGAATESRFETFRYKAEPGDILLMVSLGFLKQENADGEVYGLSRVKRVLETNQSLDLGEIRTKLLADFQGFRKTRPLRDDMTFVIARYRGP